MPKGERKRFPLLEFAGIWLMVIFGFLAVPDFSFQDRCIWIILGTIGVFVFGVVYNSRFKEGTPNIKINAELPVVAKKTAKIPYKKNGWFFLALIGTILCFVNVGMYSRSAITKWEYYSIDNVPIITYSNMYCIFDGLVAIFFTIYAVYIIRIMLRKYR